MVEIMPKSNLKNFTEKSEKVVSLWCFFEKKKILSQTESQSGQTGWKSCEKYVFQIEIEILIFVLEISMDFSDFRTLETKKAISLIDAECTIIDTPSDVRN